MADSAPSTSVYTPPTELSGPPTVRFLHYNDVYHISPTGTNAPGGAARFVTLQRHYESLPGPPLLTYFSGDAFNPSLESSITKGRHMVPILNEAHTSAACLGNHDLDFGAEQFNYLRKQCKFPWLCANIVNAEGQPVGNCEKSVMLESEGIKVGVIGLVEKEWMQTVNSLPEGLSWSDPAVVGAALAKDLREAGADVVVVVSHQREPNDNKLAEELPAGSVDLILGGHDHHYSHSVINGIHVLRSGCDFKQLSYLTGHRTGTTWSWTIERRDVPNTVPEDATTASIVSKLSSSLHAKLSKPVGYTSVPLDSRFSVIRCSESNYANFVCDLMRFYYSADCTVMAGGTIRGDQIYPPGIIKLGDVVNCFPFEDPVVVLRVSGAAIKSALENGVSCLPALEGRFPHVSGIVFSFDASLPVGSRIVSLEIADSPVDPEKMYSLATRGYMARGKDGFTSFLGAEEIVDEENGVLISMILRQYFLSLKIVGRWKRGGQWRRFFGGLRRSMSQVGELEGPVAVVEEEDLSGDSSSEDEEDELNERAKRVAAKVGNKWARLAGVRKDTPASAVDWTCAVAPKVEGRIRDLTPGKAQ